MSPTSVPTFSEISNLVKNNREVLMSELENVLYDKLRKSDFEIHNGYIIGSLGISYLLKCSHSHYKDDLRIIENKLKDSGFSDVSINFTETFTAIEFKILIDESVTSDTSDTNNASDTNDTSDTSDASVTNNASDTSDTSDADYASYANDAYFVDGQKHAHVESCNIM